MAYQYRGDKKLTDSDLRPEPARRARKTTRTVDRLEDVEYLLSAGCSAYEALERCGYPVVSSFKRAALRYGRKDLVRHVTERLAS